MHRAALGGGTGMRLDGYSACLALGLLLSITTNNNNNNKEKAKLSNLVEDGHQQRD